MDFTGKSIPDPGFAGDDGAVAPAVAMALTAYDASPSASPPRSVRSKGEPSPSGPST